MGSLLVPCQEHTAYAVLSLDPELVLLQLSCPRRQDWSGVQLHHELEGKGRKGIHHNYFWRPTYKAPHPMHNGDKRALSQASISAKSRAICDIFKPQSVTKTYTHLEVPLLHHAVRLIQHKAAQA
eukprot:scaffold1325_cov21-Tisochrysis_lutea.AAC.2